MSADVRSEAIAEEKATREYTLGRQSSDIHLESEQREEGSACDSGNQREARKRRAREGGAGRPLSVSDPEKAVLGRDAVLLGRGLTCNWGWEEDRRKTLPLPHPPLRRCPEPDPSQPLSLSCLSYLSCMRSVAQVASFIVQTYRSGYFWMVE